MTSLDVIVVDYRCPDLLAGFVKSYLAFSYLGCTLTVADVDPVDHRAEKLADDNVLQYIRFPHNVGYGRACNEAVFQSEGIGEIILLANADTLLGPGLRECAQALASFDDWGALGPRQVNEYNQIVHAGIVGHDRSPHPRAWNEVDSGQHNYVDENVISVSGSLYFIKRKVWSELTSCPLYQMAAPGCRGAFLETPHYFDETFCSYHLRNHGYKAVYYGPIQMTHFWHRASPHGGPADRVFGVSQQMHRDACAIHGITCE